MIFLTAEVALPLHGAVILPFGLVQNDAHPFARGEERGADVSHRALLALTGHLDFGPNLKDKEVICLHVALNSFFFTVREKATYLRGSNALHCSCAAHFADQGAGQLIAEGNTGEEEAIKARKSIIRENVK